MMTTPISDLAHVEASPGGRLFRHGALEFQLWLCDCSVVRDGVEVMLHPGEFRIVHGLALHFGHFVSNDRCKQLLWPDPDKEPKTAESTLKVHIAHARRKLQPVGLMLVNRPWVGYRLLDARAGG